MGAVFNASGRLTRPNGASLVGSEAIAAGQSGSFARFRATHHVRSDHVIDLDGDSARLQANLIATHPWADPERDPNTPRTHFLASRVMTRRTTCVSAGFRHRTGLTPRRCCSRDVRSPPFSAGQVTCSR